MAMEKRKHSCLCWGEVGEMYNELIDAVPENLTVLECMVGLHWTLIRSEKGTGIAKTLTGGKDQARLPVIKGMRLKDLAAYVKSWNLLQASLGMAAINSALNHENHINAISDPSSPNAFEQVVNTFVGKKVATVGYFPMLEPLGDVCQLTVIDKAPLGNHYSESVCEYILPDQDLVIITGTTFIYKTTPRLIELSKNSRIILVGANVPLSRILFKYGVDTLAGLAVIDDMTLWQKVSEGSKNSALLDSTQSVFIQR